MIQYANGTAYTFDNLAAAVAKAQAGETVTLLRDVTTTQIIKIEKAITIDLNKKTVTSTAKKAFEVYDNATIKNGTINGENRCVDTRTAVELTLTDVKLVAAKYTTAFGNPQPLTIGGLNNDGTKVYMTNVNISSEAGYGIITFVKTELTATDSEINGYSALYVKEGSAGSEFVFNNSTLTGSNAINDVAGNSFSTIAIQENGVKVTVNNGTINATGTNYAALSIGYSEQPINENNNVTLDAEINGNILETNCLDKNTVIVREDYKTVLEGLGYATSAAGTGLVTDLVKVEGAAIAMIGTTPYASITAAITAAQAGDIITLLKDVNENVTISKSLTFDGGNFNSTGLFTITNGNVTFKNFKIEGNSNYFVKVNGGGDNHVFEDCTVTNSQGLVNVAKSTNSIVVKNVTIEKCTYGARLVSFNDATFENVTIDNETRRGIDIQNQGDRNVTFINCKNYAEKPVQVQSNNSTGTVTFNFKGTNDFSINESTYSEYAKLILVDNESSLKDKEGLNVTTTFNGYSVKYLDGAYKLVPNVARIGEVTYASITAAITAAQAGDIITLLKDVNENVTISKSLTFDGGNFNSTGLFTITNGNVTFKNFKIEGNSNYFVKVNGGGDNHVFEDCTVTNSQGLVNVAKSTNSIVVKNVTIEKCTYGARLVSFNDATFENVTIDNETRRGIDIQNQGDRNVTFINCKNYAEKPVQVQSNNSTGTVTFNFKGTNDFSINESTYSEYAKLILVDNESSLKDKEGLNVTTTFNGYSVKYLDGAYKLVPNVARIGDVTYASIQEAINAAENGNEIVVLQDVTLAYEDAKQLCNGTYKSFFNVDGKNITIDLNGKTIKAEMGAELEANAVYGLVTTENNANLTIKDSSTEKTGTMWIDNVVEVYSLIMQYDGSTITIYGGNYKLNVGGNGRGMVYANDDEKVTVNGGNFHLGNVGKLQNGSPWIFNTSGQNSKNVTVYGGTYNANVFNQHYIFEVQSSKEYAIEVNSNGTWTIVPSVAWVDNQEKSGNWYTYDIGYATLEEAFAAAAKCNREDYVETVTMLQDITLKNPITVNAGEEIVLELNGKSIDVANENINCDIYGKLTLEDNVGGGVFTSRNHWVHENAEFIVNSGTVQNIATAAGGFPIYLDGGIVTINGGIVQALNGVAGGNYGNYAIGGGNGGTIVMNGGEVKGNWGAINLQAGSATINGGTLKVTAAIGGHALYVAGNATATINYGKFVPSTECSSYSVLLDSDDSEVIITDGEFHKGRQGTVLAISGNLSIKGGTFDQDVNEYCAKYFAAIDNKDGTWTVKPTQKQHLVKGWNWYSSYLDIETTDLTKAIGTNGLEIKGQTTADGSVVFDNAFRCWAGTLLEIGYNNAKMYMINTTQACELDLSANLVDPQDYTITLNTGWNWIGYPSNQSVEINVALANIPTPQEGDIIKTRNSGHAEYAWGMWVGTLKSMIPGEGYMYRNISGEAKTFKYNVTNTRGTAEANMTSENNYWTPNVAEYPYNMTMTAILDGENNGNYEIAAFVNGEVRGSARPIYVEQLDSYMFFLTVNGNNVEEMTFKCYDLTTGEEYELNNRMNYSNDAIVGSVNNPYVFTRGTLGLEEVSNFNIYPNPTTTDREINLSTTCDKVEVFNALGVKVAEYQNVDTIDAFETAGIYVIRVTNNGNVKHCRLVVK